MLWTLIVIPCWQLENSTCLPETHTRVSTGSALKSPSNVYNWPLSPLRAWHSTPSFVSRPIIVTMPS